MNFFIVFKYKKILKSKKVEFYGKLFKNSLFRPKMSQKAPRGPLGPPGGKKFLFRVTRIWKLNERKKNFWFISHRKKVGVTIPGTWPPYWIFSKKRVKRTFFFKDPHGVAYWDIWDHGKIIEKCLVKFAGKCPLGPRLWQFVFPKNAIESQWAALLGISFV